MAEDEDEDEGGNEDDSQTFILGIF